MALGKKIPNGVDECVWASCSLTRQPRELKKLRKLKHTHAAQLQIPSGAGLHKGANAHVDFWRFAGFDIVSSIIQVLEL